MPLQDIGSFETLLLAAVFVAAAVIFWATGNSDDDNWPPNSGPKMRLKGI